MEKPASKDAGFSNGQNRGKFRSLEVLAHTCERLPAIALQLQEAVKESVGDSTGLRVNAVNVNVERIVFGEEK